MLWTHLGFGFFLAWEESRYLQSSGKKQPDQTKQKKQTKKSTPPAFLLFLNLEEYFP